MARERMSKPKISKEEFIQSYQWLYGTSKKEAEYIFSISSYEYKLSVIICFTDYCQKSFYYG